MKPFKWFVIGVGTLVGVAHIGVLGHVIKAFEPTPVVVTHPPVGDYTSYTIEATPDGGYSVTYRGHDPTVLESDTYVDTSNGVFGVGGRTTTTRSEQYVPGSSNQGDSEGKNGARSEECIKAEGGGESSGALVGASLGAAAAPMLTSIPYVGWLAAGWAVMFGQDMGSSVGGTIANGIKGC